ncbi:recombination protein NinG [Utexia brackfieldae]|uniref:recombination protein NinG n=1 Tax=Utexia brackfieldae TaxID=3074108 RepID=UPI00370D18D2
MCGSEQQCSTCNNYRSGNIAEYRINLIKKFCACDKFCIFRSNFIGKSSLANQWRLFYCLKF